jgi:hypothetical protein
MPGAQRTHSLACIKEGIRASVTTGMSRTLGIPCAMALRLPSYSPRGSGFLAPVIGADCDEHPRQLGASVEASGPHDFTVRTARLVSPRSHGHRIPRPTFVTIAKRPSESA